MAELSRGDWLAEIIQTDDRLAFSLRYLRTWTAKNYGIPFELYRSTVSEAEREARWLELEPANEIKFREIHRAEVSVKKYRSKQTRLRNKALTWKDASLSLAMLEYLLEWSTLHGEVEELMNAAPPEIVSPQDVRLRAAVHRRNLR